MKVELGNGWAQDVSTDSEKYLKDGKFYSEDEYKRKTKEEDIQGKVWESVNKVGEIGLQVESIENVSVMLSRLRGEADDMIHKGLDKYFLSDSHHVINILDDYLRHVAEELKSNYNESFKMQSELLETVRAED